MTVELALWFLSPIFGWIIIDRIIARHPDACPTSRAVRVLWWHVTGKSWHEHPEIQDQWARWDASEIPVGAGTALEFEEEETDVKDLPTLIPLHSDRARRIIEEQERRAKEIGKMNAKRRKNAMGAAGSIGSALGSIGSMVAARDPHAKRQMEKLQKDRG